MIAMSLARGIALAGLLTPVAIAAVCIVREDKRVREAARDRERSAFYGNNKERGEQ